MKLPERLKQVRGLAPLRNRQPNGDIVSLALYAMLFGKKGENKKEVVMEEITQLAHENFARWNDALQTDNSEQVAALYTENCTFIPTLDSLHRKGREEARKYFDHFLLKKPFGKVVEATLEFFTEDVYLHDGLYNFEVGDANRTTVEARFTFIWQKIDGVWLIRHHHSSLLPNK